MIILYVYSYIYTYPDISVHLYLACRNIYYAAHIVGWQTEAGKSASGRAAAATSYYFFSLWELFFLSYIFCTCVHSVCCVRGINIYIQTCLCYIFCYYYFVLAMGIITGQVNTDTVPFLMRILPVLFGDGKRQGNERMNLSTISPIKYDAASSG